MRARTLAALMAVLLLAWPVAAQDQRGTIEGTVKDTSGAVVPGVTVEAKTTTGVVQSTTTDASGVFRFPSLPPGVYEVSATLASFSPQKFSDVSVGLGQAKRLEFALSLAGVQETVSVTAESPLVDVKQSARQTNIRAEQVDLLPHGRDFTSLVTQAPGANQEAKLGGLSIDGASAGENRYIIDGIETTNLISGLSGKNLIADFVDEVQVKSSGYTAEYGGATGGVINVITKSGANNLHGSGLFYFQGDSLSAGSVPAPGSTDSTLSTGRPTLRLKLTNAREAEYVTYPEDSQKRIEPGFSLGGPLVLNKAWFYAAYQPALTNTTRVVDTTTSGNANANAQNVKQKEQVQYLTANQTAQLGQNLRSRLAFNNSWSKRDGILPTLNGSDPVGTNYSKTSVFPNWSLSANVDWVATPKLFFGARGGYYTSDQHDTNVITDPRFAFGNTTNIGLAGVPVDLQRVAGFSSFPATAFNGVTRNQQTRAYFQGDGTVYGKLAGEHQLKFGVQLDQIGNNVLSGEQANLVTVNWDTALPSGIPIQRGQFGYYEVRSNGADPKKGFVTEGDISTTNIGLFIQDSWTIHNRLTINAGIRTERERVPTFTAGEDIPEFGIEFGFKDKFAPRIGGAYDLKGDGRTKVFANWGVFYDVFKLELPRGSFGGDKWLSYYYALDTPNWPTLVAGAGCPPACAGTLIRGPIDFRHPSFGSDAIDPDLKPMRQQEASAGVEHQLNDRMAVSVRYVHKQVDRAVEDTGFLLPDGSEGYVIANPGEGLTALAFTDPQVALPKAQRDYDSVEFAFEKRLASNWYLRTGYVWSRLFGNYSGLSQSDENGRTSPNVGRLFDYPAMMFDQKGQPVYGPLASDRPHQFKAQFIYQFNFGTTVGANEYIASGLPVSREIGIFPGSNYPLQYLGRESDGRTPVFSQTDLYVQHGIRLPGSREVQISLNVLNLFNQDTAVSKYSTQQRTTSLTLNEADLYSGRLDFAQLIQQQGIEINPRFLQANGFQMPIQARIGLKFIF
jgi:Carboxypeptidase regulatory-like domain/TonB dependent receptor/TonB-dependent Receptor Plug Domain